MPVWTLFLRIGRYLINKNNGTVSTHHTAIFLAKSKGLGSLRSPVSLLRKLPYYRLLLTRLRLAKDFRVRIPLTIHKNNGTVFNTPYRCFLAESKGFEPSKPFWRFTRFPIVLLRPARTTLRVTCDIINDSRKKIKSELQ